MIIGLDVGGTNIDAVLIEDKKIVNKVKKPLYENELLQSILDVIDDLMLDFDKTKIKRINLSTTVCTNAIVKNEISTVGMFIQSGPGLDIDFLSCGDDNKFITGYIDHRGRIVKDLDMGEVEEGIKSFKNKNIETCGVVTKFSTRNPSHEKRIKELVSKDFKYTTMGHSMSGKLNFPRRVYTTYLNSAVHDTFNKFARSVKVSLEKQGIKSPIYILKADGGTMGIDLAEVKPVETILSGPAASFMGINALLPSNQDGVFLDIGGTTTDIFFLVDGVPIFEPLGIQIDKYKTLIRSIYSVSIGIGGDSSIKVKDGCIEIGPKKEIKPYALGGENPTPTDAMISLNLIDYGGKQRADYIMKKLGDKLGLSTKETSELILNTIGHIIKEKVEEILERINSKPVYTVEEVLYGRRVEPRFVNIIGGPAKNLAPILEKKFKLPCRYPSDYNIANAIGAALAKPTMEINLSADTQRNIISVPELNIYDNIEGKYNLERAKAQSIQLLKDNMKSIDGCEKDITEKDIEITEESSFNMIEGFYKTGENIRVQAQIKPGLISRLRGEE